jgi:V/A-type H+-transporting ATPase subunit D
MPGKYKLTRPELKRYRDALGRFEHYLPLLKLKQQQLQLRLRQVSHEREKIAQEAKTAEARVRKYAQIFGGRAGVPVRQWAVPEEVRTSRSNIAGVEVPVFKGVKFAQHRYSLFSTAPWADQALTDLCDLSIRNARLDVARTQEQRLSRALSRVTQRVNLFEKIKIPEAREAIRQIQIKLGDEMAAAVGRAKIAKAKLADATESQTGVETVDVRSGGDAP